MKKYISEFLGTALLVIFGCGTAVAAGNVLGDIGFSGGGSAYVFLGVAISLAFGLGLMAVIYIFGHISGAHVNPAVSLGMLITGRIGLVDFFGYVASQLLGGIAGAGVLWLVFGSNASLGANGYGVNSTLVIDMWRALFIEMLLTCVFVLVILTVTAKAENSGRAGVIIGFTLTVVHLLGIPFTGTSVNPARSFGAALLTGGEALEQVWVFFVGPLLGAAVAAVVYMLLNNAFKSDKKAAKADAAGEETVSVPADKAE